MKDIITDTLKSLCLKGDAKMDTENGRKFITNELLKAFTANSIVFYSDLDKHKKTTPVKRGL